MGISAKMSYAAGMSRRLRLTLALCTFSMAGISSATAITVTTSLDLPEFATANPSAASVSGNIPVLDEHVFGSVSSERKSPWDAPNSTVNFTLNTSLYSSIRTIDTTIGARASATYTFQTQMKAVSLVWGTVGVQNTISFFLNGLPVQWMGQDFTLTGAEIRNQLDLGTAPDLKSAFVSVTNITFDELVFTAGRPAFEFANLTVTPIPLPAGLPLLAAGLVALGLIRRRRNRAGALKACC